MDFEVVKADIVSDTLLFTEPDLSLHFRIEVLRLLQRSTEDKHRHVRQKSLHSIRECSHFSSVCDRIAR